MAEKMCAREEVFLLLVLKIEDFIQYLPIKKKTQKQQKR